VRTTVFYLEIKKTFVRCFLTPHIGKPGNLLNLGRVITSKFWNPWDPMQKDVLHSIVKHESHLAI
jgi:hypothetical protein